MELDETNSEDLFKCDPVSEIDKKKDIRSVKIGNDDFVISNFSFLEEVIVGDYDRG